MSIQTIPAPASDDEVLEELEAEFLRTPGSEWSPSEIDLAETLAPVIWRIEHDPTCRITRIKTRSWCCDY